MNEKVIATMAAIVIVGVAAYVMRRAGNALRDQIKGGKK